MSLQTTIARGALDAAQAAERGHLQHCATCRRAANRRRPAERCAQGRQLRADVTETGKALRAEQAADKAPVAGEVPLF